MGGWLEVWQNRTRSEELVNMLGGIQVAAAAAVVRMGPIEGICTVSD